MEEKKNEEKITAGDWILMGVNLANLVIIVVNLCLQQHTLRLLGM